MNLDRSLIKRQARELIKGKVFVLFLLTLVVGILSNGDTMIDGIHTVLNLPDDPSSVYDYFKDFDGSGDSSFFSDNGDIDQDYFKNFSGKIGLTATSFLNSSAVDHVISVLGIFTFFMWPLIIALSGYYLCTVHGRKAKLDDGFKYLFSNTFNEGYWRKLAFVFVYNLLLVLLLFLFIVPGLIFYYKYYFATLIMAERPYLNVFDAMMISKKITKDHRSELFVLDLSFIGWLLLCIITCGLGCIYVIPYVKTTQALYYENFKIRAISEGRILQSDFLSEQQKLAFYRTTYTNWNQNQNNTAVNADSAEDVQQETEENSFGSGMDTDYYNNNF